MRRQVYVMKSDGSEPKNLTNTEFEEADASWSPDGRSIVFVSFRNGRPTAFVMNDDGSEARTLSGLGGLHMRPMVASACN